MRVLLFLGALLLTTGCSHLILHEYDSTATQAAKVAARIPLGLVTLGGSEMYIHEVKSQRACEAEGGWYFMGGCRENSESNRNRATMLMPSMINANAQYFHRQLTPPPVPSVPPIQPSRPLTCTSQRVGAQTFTTCQ